MNLISRFYKSSSAFAIKHQNSLLLSSKLLDGSKRWRYRTSKRRANAFRICSYLSLRITAAACEMETCSKIDEDAAQGKLEE